MLNKELYKQHNYLDEKNENSLYTQINLINFFIVFAEFIEAFLINFYNHHNYFHY